MREILPKGHWRHSSVFEQVDTAIESDYTPTQFWGDLSEQDRAWIIARRRSKNTITQWENYLHDQEMRRNKKSKGSGRSI